MLTLLAAVVTLACIAASARRLRFALAPTPFDPEMLLRELRGEPEAARARAKQLLDTMRSEPEAEWERELFEASMREGSPEPSASASAERAALVNEQLFELDARLQRWARVPRVCASIAASSGFMLAALALRNDLADPNAFAPEVRSWAVEWAVFSAINTAAIGIVGTTFCIAAQARARKGSRARHEATDRLVERLEALFEGEARRAPS
jgi:hypothetical protein